jgi:hypothetical protein
MVLDGVSFFLCDRAKTIFYFLLCHTDFLYFYNNMFLLAFYNKGNLL